MSLKQEIDDSNDGEMSNMFASVWVKVEVDDEEEQDGAKEPTDDKIEIPMNYSIPIAKKNLEKMRSKRKRYYKKDAYQCDMCDYTTGYKNCLEMHLIGHSDEKRFSCDTCGYITKYPTSLHRHIVIKHNPEMEKDETPTNKYNCDACDYTTPYKWNLSAHKRKHKVEKQFKCIHCTFETAYRHSFVKHAKTHRDPIVFKCDKCPFVTRFEGHIARHLSQIHNEVESSAKKCDHCKFATKYNWRLNIHKARSKKDAPIKCYVCDFETLYSCEYRMHKASHFGEPGIIRHSINEIPANESDIDYNEKPCEQNDVVNYDSNNVAELNDSFNLGDITKCNDLNLTSFHDIINDSIENKSKKTFLNYDVDPDCIDWHDIQVLESDNKEKPFQCHMCVYTSRFKAAVQRHFQRHHTGVHNRPYKCCNCDFSTKTKDQISLHNKRSKSDTAIQCNTCGFRTFFKCQFVMHQKNHYAFKCEQCSYVCRHNHELQKHVWVVHLGNGLKCRFCDYKSTRKESIMCHETTHTGNKPFKCKVCDYSAVRKSLLDNHMKRTHRDVENERIVVHDGKLNSLMKPMSMIKDKSD